ncbi:oligosaccharide flippase family protein [Pseudofulvibacter geojedonensis]|uniref:Oligosaccharide flippase family protein n=1 Tax=Pseudofulvibacter geojedonensis TaxID=1123758 RepID=A0ABW3I4V9_9FLAO
MQTLIKIARKQLSSSHVFFLSVLLVNIGNYAFNLLMGRLMGPVVFSEIAFLVTLLLALSFLAMTIQLVATKYVIELNTKNKIAFTSYLYKWAIGLGFIFAALFILFATPLANTFKIQSPTVFYFFGMGIPVYFVMSVTRGLNQGQQDFIKLSISYISEMVFRFVISFLLIFTTSLSPIVAVSIGILVSFIAGLWPNSFKWSLLINSFKLSSSITKPIITFLSFTGIYECTQIIINNSDILLVKHYFDAHQAGLYASLALIGRVVYFMIWMLIMVFIPKVIEAKHSGKNPKIILLPYFKGILCITTALVVGCAICPELIISIFFGEAYIEMAPLLYQYALATSLFALANLFCYYYLSLSIYKPVILAFGFASLQLVSIALFHNSLTQVVQVQIAIMSVLLIILLAYFFSRK